MAQKQFKIGLSNTDKQNMAQDVYERVLALTFNEYDTTTEYEVGDFVVYNDQLYKCISATSGAWDSSKWQLATLNDLVTDIENAVQFVNDKANVDGNYPTMTVGFADNLTPYDESSGDDQDEPFSFQETGTGNGSQPDFSTGSAALMKEKQGHSVCVNQRIQNGDFSNGLTNWNAYSGTGNVSNNTLTVTGAVGRDGVRYIGDSKTIGGHKYLFSWEYTSTVNAEMQYALLTYSICPATNSFTKKFALYEPQQDETYGIRFDFFPSENGVSGDLQLKNCFCVDLTQWFGSNDAIPQDLLDHPDHFFRYYQGSLAYNEGTLVNSNGRYLKTIGRNQWDEVAELGGIDTTTGQNVADNTRIRSKNYIKVIPNKTYYGYIGGQGYFYPRYYDANKNFIGVGTPAQEVRNSTFTVPSNACYMRWQTYDYGTTYNHDITISLYYEDESGYEEYYPYEVLTNNDTGTETLRSAGSVKDSKAPDGTVHRMVGTLDLSTIITQQSQSGIYTIVLNPQMPRGSENIIFSSGKYTPADGYGVMVSTNKTYYRSRTDDNFYIHDDDAIPSDTINYELAEETTEQGTPYSENVEIDDFGSMDFAGNNGVPQGANIFYPVDYKAYIDTLYKYTNGAPSNIALKSDLPTAPQTWAESLPGYDATKTQTLKNVEGTLTWVDDE